ncbi:MAG: acetate kinase [Hyphomicrobiaceae bacterium]|jgi:acetate kinase
MRILVVNAGSTSLKCELFEFPQERSVVSGSVSRIGQSDALLRVDRHGSARLETSQSVADHEAALEALVAAMGLDRSKPNIVGHRVAHGGETLVHPTLLDAAAEQAIADCARFAPLHNPANLAGVRACRSLFPGLAQVAVMDTAFHRTLRPQAFLYAIPYELYEQHGIRRYGFHGTSHRYVAGEAARVLGTPLEQLRIVSCHLGGGASVCAIADGASQATSMGMTPLEGLVMGTRCGDVDPGVVLHLQDRLGMTREQVETMLNRESGLKGISGIGRDMRELVDAAAGGSERAQLAIDMFCRQLRHYIGGYTAELGGLDVLVFTGGIGENASSIRELTLQGLDVVGLHLDRARNEAVGEQAAIISRPGSTPAILVVPTDEELQIAREIVADQSLVALAN